MMTQKNKRGRPSTGITPMRGFRMSETDYEFAKKAAQLYGTSLASFIREAVLDRSRRVFRSLK